MSDKKSFILYLDQQELFNKLPDDIAGKLIKHIFSYVNCEDPKSDELIIDVAFASIKQALKRDLSKWTSQREQRSKAGKASAEKRANEKQRNSTTVNNRSTNSTVSDTVSVNVSDSDSDSDSENIKDLSPRDDVNSFLINDIFNYWVNTMGKSNRTSLTTLRKNKIKSRLKDGYPAYEIKQAIDNVSKDQFLVAGGHTDIEMICRSDTNLEKYRDAMPMSKGEIRMSRINQDIEDFANGGNHG